MLTASKVAANIKETKKLKLLVIGNSMNSRRFRGIKSQELDYDVKKKLWLTSILFEIFKFDSNPTHPQSIQNPYIMWNFFYFPLNTTSKLQPMDQDIIKNLKVYYRKRIMTKSLTAREKIQPQKKLISLRDILLLNKV